MSLKTGYLKIQSPKRKKNEEERRKVRGNLEQLEKRKYLSYWVPGVENAKGGVNILKDTLTENFPNLHKDTAI